MRIIHGRHFPESGGGPRVVTMGNFDGVHRGHAKVIARTCEKAASRKVKAMAITFNPHPEHVISRGTGPALLTSWKEKAAFMEPLGMDMLWVLPFNSDVANLTAAQFFNQIIRRESLACSLIMGHDHRFGKGAEGDFPLVKEWAAEAGMDTELVEPEMEGGKAISSTWIRKWVSHGELQKAVGLMGHPYLVAGSVVPGMGLGRKLGYPTINVEPPDSQKLLPGPGVYSSLVKCGENEWVGALYVGIRPTFDSGPQRLEIHILHFEGDLYGQEVLIYMFGKIRDEQKFGSEADLVRQIECDVLTIKSEKAKGILSLERSCYGADKGKGC